MTLAAQGPEPWPSLLKYGNASIIPQKTATSKPGASKVCCARSQLVASFLFHLHSTLPFYESRKSYVIENLLGKNRGADAMSN